MSKPISHSDFYIVSIMTTKLSFYIGRVELLYEKNKISVFADISILGFYGNIENIGKYQWIF